MRYRVHSPLFHPETPSRIYAGRVNQTSENPNEFCAFIEATHLDPQGRPVKTVISKMVGYFRTRHTARRNVLRELSFILSEYPEENITSLSKTVKTPKEN